MKRELSLLVFSLAFAPILAKSASVVSYNLNGSLAASSSDANLSAGNINFLGSGASRYVLPNELGIVTASGALNAPTAVANASYFQFSVTPNTGSSLSLNSLTFRGATSNSSTPNNGYVVTSSVDGFSSILGSGAFPTSYPTYSMFSVDLTGSSFQGLTTETTFRVYTWKDSGSNPAAAYDDVTLNGSVALVPEPTTLTVSLASGLLLLGRRRRRTA